MKTLKQVEEDMLKSLRRKMDKARGTQEKRINKKLEARAKKKPIDPTKAGDEY